MTGHEEELRARRPSSRPDVFASLASPTRREILNDLARRRSATASELAEELPVTRQAVVKHLTLLGEAGLVTSRRVGREVRYRVAPEPLADVAAWLARLGSEWDQRLERLSQILAAHPVAAGETPERPEEPPVPDRPDEIPAPQRPDEPPVPERPDEIPAPQRPDEPPVPERPDEVPIPEHPDEIPAPQRPDETPERPAELPTPQRPDEIPAPQRPDEIPAREPPMEIPPPRRHVPPSVPEFPRRDLPPEVPPLR